MKNYQEVLDALEDLRSSGAPIKVYCDGELYDIRDVIYSATEDPDGPEPAVVIRVG